MKAIRFIEPWSSRLEEIPEPEAGEGEVLVRVAATGVCASDILALSGRHPFRTLPSFPGHEAAGRVVHVGPGVTGFTAGDRVCIEPQRTCGKCEFCQSGEYQLCPEKQMLGTPAWPGSFAEYVTVPAFTLYHLPPEVDFTLGSMIEPLAVAAHCVGRLEAKPGLSYAILGAGTIGTLILLMLKAYRQPAFVLVTDPRAFSRDLAVRLGASLAIDPGKGEPDVLEAAVSQLGRRWVDAAFSVVTLDSVVNDALRIVKPGGTVVEVATFGNTSTIDLRLLQTHERRMVGTVTYQRRDYEMALQYAAGHPNELRSLITSEIDLTQAEEYFNSLAQNRYGSDMKVVIHP